VIIGLLVASTAGCSTGDGTTLRAPEPGQTAPIRTTTSTAAPGSLGGPTDKSTGVSITSPAFVSGGVVPDAYTCKGEGTSPPLEWTNTNAGAEELVLLITDRTAGGAVHWLVADIPPDAGGFAENGVPNGVETDNYEGGRGWAPLCPPPGETHTYDFSLYALAEASGITPDQPPAEAVQQLSQRLGWRATLTGTVTG
jgi:phosphatidylethanolamine-binding protein (PEBP) family uncharacterized protein